jgi:hypothetical protein
MKSGNLNFLETSGPLQACNGTDCFGFTTPARRKTWRRLGNFVESNILSSVGKGLEIKYFHILPFLAKLIKIFGGFFSVKDQMLIW